MALMTSSVYFSSEWIPMTYRFHIAKTTHDTEENEMVESVSFRLVEWFVCVPIKSGKMQLTTIKVFEHKLVGVSSRNITES